MALTLSLGERLASGYPRTTFLRRAKNGVNSFSPAEEEQAGSASHPVPRVFLSLQPAGRLERRVAAAAIVVTGIVFAVLAPFAQQQLGRSDLFLPLYQSALVICDLVTAVFLFGQFGVLYSRMLLVLGGGYLFSAVMAIFHMIAFPGLFSSGGLMGAGPQTSAWVYFMWHIGFPATVIAYAVSNNRQVSVRPSPMREGLDILTAVLLSIGAACIIFLVTTAGHDYLPVIMNGHQDLPAKYAVAWLTWIITLAALPLLWRQSPMTTLNLWLTVVIVTWACDVAQAAVFNAGRFSLGWYAGRVFGLIASSFLLAMLILESGRLYRRLAESYAAERGQRKLVEERTAQLDALNETLERRVHERTEALAASNRYLQQAREELKELGMLSATAREQERARIARDLHDELGQLLVLVKDHIWEMEQSLDNRDAGERTNVRRVQELVDLTLSTTKRLATNLRPDILDILGLVDALDWLVGTYRESSKTIFRLDIKPQNLSLEEPWSTVVFRVIQESLTNIVRHADATTAQISLWIEDGVIRLQIRDDGRGFDVESPRKSNAFGLVSMRERVYLVSGQILIDSFPEGGTTVDVSIPLAKP